MTTFWSNCYLNFECRLFSFFFQFTVCKLIYENNTGLSHLQLNSYFLGSCSPPGFCFKSSMFLSSPPADENVCWEAKFSRPYQTRKDTCQGVISLQRHDLLISETSGQPLAQASPSDAGFILFFCCYITILHFFQDKSNNNKETC